MVMNLLGFLNRMSNNQMNLGQIMLHESLYPKNTIQLYPHSFLYLLSKIVGGGAKNITSSIYGA
jgi:hypothetical protein